MPDHLPVLPAHVLLAVDVVLDVDVLAEGGRGPDDGPAQGAPDQGVGLVGIEVVVPGGLPGGVQLEAAGAAVPPVRLGYRDVVPLWKRPFFLRAGPCCRIAFFWSD